MIANLIYWITQKKWLIIATTFGFFLYIIPTPQGLSINGYHTLIIVAVALILIIFEPVPLPAVAFFILFMQVIITDATPNEVASSFMSDAVFFIMGSLMLAVAIVKQGLDKRLALGIIRTTGNKTWRIVAGFTAISAILSSFIGEHTVAAMMMPVGLTLIRNTSKDPSKIIKLSSILLFSIAYGATIGSVGTPSGGGRNVIMLEYWSDFGIGNISYLTWMKYAYPMVILQIPLTVLILWWTFTPEKKTIDTGVRKLVIQVAKSGKMNGKQILSIFLFVLVFIGWIFFGEKIGLGFVALIGVFLYLIFGLVEWSDLNRSTNWGVILLFGATISIGLAMKKTGAAEWLAMGALNTLNSFFHNIDYSRAGIAVILTGVLSNILSSSATIAVVGPIVLNLGGDPVLLGFATAIASAFGYFTVVASPACMIIYSSGMVKTKDFLRAGWKMGIMSVFMLFLVSFFWWPFLQ
ncbi:MAG: DASS family sodium-coupled anion symporter [Candidatus Marinimicrobia bacterium]|nr:DASS family sodium-coupled anion symporter [Candidatus Neomarinimicrobiota bacterium]